MASFNEEERQQLREAFELSDDSLELLLGGSAFILEQAAYTPSRPPIFPTHHAHRHARHAHRRAARPDHFVMPVLTRC